MGLLILRYTIVLAIVGNIRSVSSIQKFEFSIFVKEFDVTFLFGLSLLQYQLNRSFESET